MKVQIRSVADKGNLEKERLVLKVIANTDIGDYVVLRTGYQDNSVTILVHNAFWFPYKSVTAGDLVVVYTKSGRDSEKELGNGRMSHFFYWGLDKPIWNRDDRAAVILYSPEWESKGSAEL